VTRAVVTGAAGFLGFALAKRLAGRPGTDVFAVDDFSRGVHDDNWTSLCGRPNVTGLDLDLADPVAVLELPPEVDWVFHLAALNGTQNFYERPYEVVRACTLPTFHLIDRYRRAETLKRFVFAGSSEAYASTVARFGWPVPTAEDVPLSIDDVGNPRWSYGASKLHGEVLVTHAMRQFRQPYTIVRYHNCYGPRMGDKHVVPDFLARMDHGVYELYGAADTRSFLYVADAVEATLALAECPEAAGEIVNVGGGTEIAIRDLATRILRLARIDAPIVEHPAPPGSVPRRAPDVSKLRRLTGFVERWSLDDGLRETMRHYLRNVAVPDR